MTEKLLLCATDLEDDAAPDLAAAACRALNARLLLVHAVDPDAPEVDAPDSIAPAIESLEERVAARRQEAEKKLEETRARLATEGCEVEVKLIPGVTPADAILREAQEAKPALIVLGRRHQESGILAKTIDQVCRRALCPVFVAPNDAEVKLEGGRWLVGADLSSHSVRAIRAAKALAGDTGKIRVVQVIAPMGDEEEDIERSPQDILREQGIHEDAARLAELVASELEGGETAQIRSLDRAQEALNREASDWNASVIVVGTHGRSGLARLFLGSTAEALLRTSSRPVLVVRDAPHAASPLYAPVTPAPASIGPNRILVATDFSEPARRALETAHELSDELEASVTVVHVFDDPGDIRRGIVGRGLDAPRASALPEGARAQLEEALSKMVADVFGDDAGSVTTVLAVGRPVEEILRHARAYRADLLVVGTTGRTGVERLLLGSVAEKVVREGTIPVLTVP
jgi:nucleotide-binding universal stress UspA family protein